MPDLRLEGPNFTLESSTLPEQALSARNRKFMLPGHMPAPKHERLLLSLKILVPGTELIAQWLPVGQKHLAGRRPSNPGTVPRLIFHATVNEEGFYKVYSDTPGNYNCHWVLWMHHDDCMPLRYRCVWGHGSQMCVQKVLV